MSDHYCCKTCHLRYDDCTCTSASTPPQAVVRDDFAVLSTNRKALITPKPLRPEQRQPVKPVVAKAARKPTPPKAVKCTLTTFCDALDARVEAESNYRGKGIISLCAMNTTTGEMFSPGLCYKTSAKDRGLMLNFCPFCGTDLTSLFKRSRSKT